MEGKTRPLRFGMAVAAACGAAECPQSDAARHPDLFKWANTCNVYILRAGTALDRLVWCGGQADAANVAAPEPEGTLFTPSMHHTRAGDSVLSDVSNLL